MNDQTYNDWMDYLQKQLEMYDDILKSLNFPRDIKLFYIMVRRKRRIYKLIRILWDWRLETYSK